MRKIDIDTSNILNTNNMSIKLKIPKPIIRKIMSYIDPVQIYLLMSIDINTLEYNDKLIDICEIKKYQEYVTFDSRIRINCIDEEMKAFCKKLDENRSNYDRNKEWFFSTYEEYRNDEIAAHRELLEERWLNKNKRYIFQIITDYTVNFYGSILSHCDAYKFLPSITIDLLKPHILGSDKHDFGYKIYR